MKKIPIPIARYVLGANMFKRANGITLKEDHGVQARKVPYQKKLHVAMNFF
jgi:hypothetical protein